MPRKRKGALRKKGRTIVRGMAAQYVTRKMALRKLQLSLPQFRKLCILKGIYPREPRKAAKGKDKTYYLKKDIAYMMHDPLILKFQEHRIWKRKVKRYRERGNQSMVESLMKQQPSFSLNHLVRERYPTFMDALQDLDDCLSLVSLFAQMPSTPKIEVLRVENCKRLIHEFKYYVVKTNSLRKVFLAQKGVYYQVEVFGQTITWVAPYQFAQPEVDNVDYRVMLSFLEFYEVLLGFVNFRLMSSINVPYPPAFDEKLAGDGALLDAIREELAQPEKPVALPSKQNGRKPANPPVMDIDDEVAQQMDESKSRLQSLNAKLSEIAAMEKHASDDDEDDMDLVEDGPDDSDQDDDSDDADSEMDDDENDEDSEDEDNDEDVDEQGMKVWNNDTQQPVDEVDGLDTFEGDNTTRLLRQQNIYSTLFSKCHFKLSREVPRDLAEFVVKSFGGVVSWDGSPTTPSIPVTHFIYDRPTPLEGSLTYDVVQPQWIFDSVNNKILLPVSDYAPGVTLPPHLSPFVDDSKTGYIPEYRKKLNEYYAQTHGLPLESQTEAIPFDESEENSEEEEERYAQELAAEAGRLQALADKKEMNKKETKKSSNKKVRAAEEEEDQTITAGALLPNRKRRLLERIRYSKRMRSEEIDSLENKRRRLENGETAVAAAGGKYLITESSK